MTLFRHCPRCGSARPVTELVCEGRIRDQPCRWSLFDVLPAPAATEATRCQPEASPPSAVPNPQSLVSSQQCRNGHLLGPGDFLCVVCGEGASPSAGATTAAPVPSDGVTSRVAKGWRLGAALSVVSGESDLFLATRDGDREGSPGPTAVLKHYRRGIEPQSSLYQALRSLDPDHSVRLLDDGRFEDRAFEVWEFLPLGTLGNIPVAEKGKPEFVREVVREIGGALHGLAEAKIIHRDLKPANVLVRSREPLDLVLTDFSTATVSEFDLQLTVARQTTRYAAPETIVGTCSPASDWWSLGVIVLEMLTQGHGFEGVHERAFLLHLVTRGLRVPRNLPEEWQELLMGLLTRDPARRWTWPQVQRWLGGERGIAHGYGEDDCARMDGPSLSLGQRAWPTPESFALAAAEAATWDEAKDLLRSGRLATWLQERPRGTGSQRASQVRSLAIDPKLPDDARLAASLLVLNENLPLCLRGEIVTPAWLLSHPDVAVAWLESSLPGHLRRINREPWFVRLRERADRVHARIRDTGIPCDESQLSVALLATSQSMLETHWRSKRRMFPEAEHPALAAAVERRAPSEEDLILLVSATVDSFRSADDVLKEAAQEAARTEVSFSAAEAAKWLDFSRREILDALNERLAHFVRCGYDPADQWADDFRQMRRLTMARGLVLLAIPASDWRPPPKQEYVRNVLDFFHRRLVSGMQRGGLVRMLIGRTTARLDLTELGGTARSAETLLSAVLTRQVAAVRLDPSPLQVEPLREQRLRRLQQKAAEYRRDTGISALYLGFPFVVLRDGRASEETKPRIAPVLLWPVRLDMPAGERGNARLAFDTERGEVRINPALEGLLGGASADWDEVLNDLRDREHLDLPSTIDALAPLSRSDEPGTGPVSRLKPLPPSGVRVAAGQIQVHASAVLFLCDFSGQTIAEDLKHIAGQPIAETALEVAIRVGAGPTPDALAPDLSEADHYFTAPADPSQQMAVFRARQKPGLVVQGPPGTGKSQTIVNMVCDAIGRGDRVLIVCQKRAALEVVCKRLETEGLVDRLFILNDPVSDRRQALQALRQQLERPQRTPAEEENLRHVRAGCARQIEVLEKELNAAHTALGEVVLGRAGNLSYRGVIEELLAVERGPGPPVSYAPLGAAFDELDHTFAEQLVSEIALLAPLWREAKYEESPLHCLAQFRTDDSALADFQRVFGRLREAERQREDLLAQYFKFFDLDEPAPLLKWLGEHETELRGVPSDVADSLARWGAMVRPPTPDSQSPAEQLVPWLKETGALLEVLDEWVLNSALYEKMAEHGTLPLAQLTKDVGLLCQPPRSVFSRLSLARWFARVRVLSWLKRAGTDLRATELVTLHDAMKLELEVRDSRAILKQWQEALGWKPPAGPQPLPALRSLIRQLLDKLAPVIEAGRRICACPLACAGEEMSRGRDSRVYASVLEACHASIAMQRASCESKASLQDARVWFEPDWVAALHGAIAHRRPSPDSLVTIAAALPSLRAFQTFRLRAHGLSSLALGVFALMRECEVQWQRFSDAELPREVTRTLRREALLAWKQAAEQACPALLMERQEKTERIRLLAVRDREMREANRRLLAQCSADTRIAGRGQWDDVVMLQGPRARRLREVVARGAPLGLFHLRPVWMMNPEMVSRLFALRPGLFDLVIFDEASQLPVECALPALFRARRAVVSGDEKQMPPSHFFSLRLDSDEESTGEEWLDAEDENLDESERERLRQVSDRREVKDCPDLLTLAQTILPTATLEIHYRSKFRELIGFSNAAFYSGRLSVPSRHPESVIRKERPLEVDRVSGCYVNQTNEAEANRVVERLRELWRLPFGQRPSVGVLTFNLKQADLIQDRLEDLAESDAGFCRAWEEEQERKQRGEDMGFFVKNLENVQGDERDWIVFSTTFGRDASGVFRRNFGVLGQHGGERRLNVAITRARVKVLVITSLPVSQVSSWTTNHGRRRPSIPRDYLQGWLAYAEHLSAGELMPASELLVALNSGSDHSGPCLGNSQPPISAFRDEVADFLRSNGYEPVPARDDAFGVDFALVDPRTGLFGLGIECEAPHHAVLTTVRARELWRPSVIAASMPALHRVALREWYHDRRNEQDRLRAAARAALGQ